MNKATESRKRILETTGYYSRKEAVAEDEVGPNQKELGIHLYAIVDHWRHSWLGETRI